MWSAIDMHETPLSLATWYSIEEWKAGEREKEREKGEGVKQEKTERKRNTEKNEKQSKLNETKMKWFFFVICPILLSFSPSLSFVFAGSFPAPPLSFSSYLSL